MNEPESHPPEGAHMGTFMEDCHRTAIDLEDTGAALSRVQRERDELREYVHALEVAIKDARDYLNPENHANVIFDRVLNN